MLGLFNNRFSTTEGWLEQNVGHLFLQMANFLTIEKRIQIYHLLCEGNGITSISRIVGCSKQTITLLLARFSAIVDYLNKKLVRDIEIEMVEADEIRTFVRIKENIRWIYIAMDRESRLVINFHVGSRDAVDAKIFLSDLSYKLNSKTPVAMDCLKSYVTAVKRTPYGRIEAATSSIGLLRAKDYKKELPRSITNRIETHNGNVRQHVSRLTRKTRCFSKSDDKLKQHLNLFFFYYNFIKIHKAIKTTPAVSSGIADKPFTFDVLIDYDNMFTENPSKRGKYKPREKKKRAKVVSIDKEFMQEIKSGMSANRKVNNQ